MELRKAAQAGGVAVALAELLRERPGLWFGWNGKVVEEHDSTDIPELRTAKSAGRSAIATLPLTAAEHRDYYLGYSNSVLWPVFHNRLDLAQFDAGFYARYIGVNDRFARALRPLIQPDDIIWIHDYHLIPLAAELRRAGVDNPIGFYLHIPVPPSQTFLAIPEYRELARALTAYDLIGLQTQADVANLIQFLEDSVSGRILQDGRVSAFDHRLSIKRFPVGIDADVFAGGAPEEKLVQATEGADRIIGATLMPDPQNFRPSWFHARDYGLLVANPFGRRAFKQGEASRVPVPPATPLRLRFGVYIHSTAPNDPPDLPAEYRAFVATTFSPRN